MLSTLVKSGCSCTRAVRFSHVYTYASSTMKVAVMVCVSNG